MAEPLKPAPDLTAAARNLRDRDPLAFLLPPRIVRRVIKQDRDLPGFGFRVPHRKSYVLPGERLRQFVAVDELGLTSVSEIPETVLLIAEPKESELAGMERADLQRWIWRIHFHARVHHELERRLASHALKAATVRSRIDRIGQVEFDEARAVLQNEHFLIGRPDSEHVYIEFAAVFLEFKHFSPQRLGWYFPSCEDAERVEAIISADLDVAALLELTRPVALSDPATAHSPPVAGQQADQAAVAVETVLQSDPIIPVGTTVRAAARARKLADRATRADERGNTVRAVILHTHAVEQGDAETATSSQRQANDGLDRFVARLKAALEFDESEAAEWRDLLADLLALSTRGFWNADLRMFYDLQKVCLDHERDVFRIDLLEWVRSRGRRPIKRPLENQREVLMVKHLRSALRRLNASGLSASRRDKFSQLLHVALDSAEHQLRERLRPLVDASLAEVGFRAANLPERVAAAKLTEELLDAVVKRGYLTMDVLRDGISRCQLKLPDLAGPMELWKGDRLLKADRQLSESLDGVYRRGPFYLRWLQRLSSIVFGTVVGRWLTMFALLPFAGAFVTLSFIAHAVEIIGIHAEPLLRLETVIAGGLFLLGLIHWRAFRAKVHGGLVWLMKALGSILIDMPVWAIRNPAIRRFLRTPAVVFLRRYVIQPGLLTGLFCLALPGLGLYAMPSLPTIAVVYTVFAVLLNTRFGRDVEEITTDWLEHS
ncbi:MAG: hypothetical protein IID45_04230, partial [Planctomycetes bacterium]|nr:hypothetical protein [Planctomycetota bacterium]